MELYFFGSISKKLQRKIWFQSSCDIFSAKLFFEFINYKEYLDFFTEFFIYFQNMPVFAFLGLPYSRKL